MELKALFEANDKRAVKKRYPFAFSAPPLGDGGYTIHSRRRVPSEVIGRGGTCAAAWHDAAVKARREIREADQRFTTTPRAVDLSQPD